MPTEAQLPQDFAPLAGRVSYVQRKNDNEYSSSCPQCGGSIHENGEWPDRFVMWRSNKHGEPFGICLRGHCGFKWSPKVQTIAVWTTDELKEFRAKRDELDAAYNAQVEQRLAELSARIETEGAYKRYHGDGLASDAAQAYWERRQIPIDWQIHLSLGYIQDYKVTGRLSTYRSPAYTIPVWSEACRIENIKVRVAEPKDDNDRYRNLYKSGCQHLYNPLRMLAHGKFCVLMEGEFKAIATAEMGKVNWDNGSLYGVQSKEPEERLLKYKLQSFEIIYIALDPDAYQRHVYYDPKTGEEKLSNIAAFETAKKVGLDRARLVIPPRGVKFDDAIMQGYNFLNALNMAIKPERLTA